MSIAERNFVDWTGKTNGQGLDVLRLVSVRPPAYAVRCSRCGCEESRVAHARISYAACRNASCGKPNRRDRLEEERQAAAQRRAELESAEREASERRMAFETEDHVLPSKIRPAAEHVVLTERQRIAGRDRRAAEEAEQRAADAPRLAKEREQAQQITRLREEHESTFRQLHAIERERVATAKDEAFQVDPATCGPSAAVPESQLDAWHAAQMTQFRADNPTYYPCGENQKVVEAYLDRNAPGLKLVSAAQLTAAVKRLNEFGLLTKRPAPVIPEPKPVTRAKPQPSPSRPTAPETFVGRDPVTGRDDRVYTAAEVRRMTADEYKRAFKVAPTLAEFFTAVSNQRNAAK